ncbi:MAG TPA: type IX secretion system sortase PorU, partial [Chitinophagales bacterium]|nr:type IX secretion system sortase PorU [Chitinophagales bacterium]
MKRLPSFDGAEFLPENDFLPNYYESVPVGTFGSVEAVVINPVYEPLPAEGLTLSKEKILPELKIAAQNGLIKKKPVAAVSFVPIRKNAITGELEKLVEFDLEIRVNAVRQTYAFKQTPAYAQNSVLNAGTWHKISVDRDGIYKLDYNFLKNMGIAVDNIDPRSLRIYGNGGGMLPEENAAFRHDDLVENSIYVSGESDGRFDPGDYVLFYGQSPHRWRYDSASQKFRHQTNLYSDFTCYFITTGLGPGKTRWTVQPSLSNPTITVTSFDDYIFHESDLSNLLTSGREWYGEYFNFSASSYSFNFNFPNLVTSVPVSLKSSIAARSTSQTSYFSVTANGQTVNTHSITKVGTNYTDTYAREDARENTFTSSSDQINVTVSFTNPSSAGEGWLNYLELNGRRNLVYNGSQFIFRDKNSVGAANKAEFVLQNVSSAVKILDVTDPVNVFIQQYALNGTEARFTVSTDTLREFIVFSENSGLLTPVAGGAVENQNLHAIGQPDMLIIAHPSFLNEANALAAHHRTENNLTVEVVNVLHIYNEFSSGVQDISAIRDFIRMIYIRAGNDTSRMPKYLLLFGDGSYDYKDKEGNNNNMVPTYQSPNSLEPTQTFVSDDYFGFLDDNEGGSFISGSPDYLDIAIGRLPVSTPDEAQSMVNKIIRYQSNQSSVITPAPGCSAVLDQSSSVFGNWRNILTFIGDDEDGSIHMSQADDLAEYFEVNHPEYNIDKIYLDAYQQQSTPGGSRYPDVNEAIGRRIFSGTLIMNYTGHGGVNGWAHERILDVSGINSWNNFDKLPLFITATCEFSKFDDPGKVSAGEMVLLNANGGAIAMVTTTRLVYSGANFTLNNNFL